jgi:hypothetical protein
MQTMSFAAFLSSFFPQLRGPLQQTKEQHGSIIVKYYPHQVEMPVTQPPARLDSIAYQTLGTIDEPVGTMLKR